MSRSESNIAGTLPWGALVPVTKRGAEPAAQSRRTLNQWFPIETTDPAATWTTAPGAHRVRAPSAVVTIEPLVEPRSVTNRPLSSRPSARWDLDTVRLSSASLISSAPSSPGRGWGLRPSRTSPCTGTSLPSSSTATQRVSAFVGVGRAARGVRGPEPAVTLAGAGAAAETGTGSCAGAPPGGRGDGEDVGAGTRGGAEPDGADPPETPAGFPVGATGTLAGVVRSLGRGPAPARR